MVHPFSPDVWPDPYPTYRELAQAAPLFADTQSGMTFVLRYDDADELLRDRTVSNAQDQRRRDDSLPSTMLNSDPPEHTRLRANANVLFSAATLEELGPRFDAEISDQIRDTSKAGDVEVVSELGRPFATGMLSVLFSLSGMARAQFSMLMPAASANLNPLASPAQLGRAAKASGALAGLLANRAAAAGSEVDSPLGRFWNNSELTEDERVSTLMLVAVGAWEPLSNLAATGTWLLAQDPELLERVAMSPDNASAFVDEILRLESPIPFVARQLTGDVALPSGTLTAPGTSLVLLGAANRDPTRFDDPDTVRLDRGPAKHLAFGSGVHRCPGASLTRALGSRFFSALADGFQSVAQQDPAASVTWRPSIVPRGISEYRVSLRQRDHGR